MGDNKFLTEDELMASLTKVGRASISSFDKVYKDSELWAGLNDATKAKIIGVAIFNPLILLEFNTENQICAKKSEGKMKNGET